MKTRMITARIVVIKDQAACYGTPIIPANIVKTSSTQSYAQNIIVVGNEIRKYSPQPLRALRSGQESAGLI